MPVAILTASSLIATSKYPPVEWAAPGMWRIPRYSWRVTKAAISRRKRLSWTAASRPRRDSASEQGIGVAFTNSKGQRMGNKRLAGKVAIVTGAGCVGPGWGNGRAIAYRFAEEGARIMAVDRDMDAMKETLEK